MAAVLSPGADSSLCLTPIGLPVSNEQWCRWILCFMCFFAASWQQSISHSILSNLRWTRSGTQIAKSTYSIPHGGGFDFISCPHYLAEICIYVSLACLRSGSLIQWLVLVFVASNLCITATRTHKWYQRKFSEYPLQRKCLIPFLY